MKVSPFLYGDIVAAPVRYTNGYGSKRGNKLTYYYSRGAWLQVASMVLVVWGFTGLVVSTSARAELVFEQTLLSGVAVNSHAKPSLVDIDNDGDLDAFIGGGDGMVAFYRNTGTSVDPVFEAADGAGIINPLAGFDVGGDAAPTFADIDNDGDLDAFVGEVSGTVKFYRNTGTVTSPIFAAADGAGIINPLDGFVVVNGAAAPIFADIDNDGDLDVFIGEGFGTVKFYRNTGTVMNPVFAAANGTTIINPLDGFDVGFIATPTFADVDNDGDLDAFIGEGFGAVKFYRNTGNSAAPVFVAANGAGIINPLAGLDIGFNAAPALVDIDNDGDLDVFIGDDTGTVKFYRNNGAGLGSVSFGGAGCGGGSSSSSSNGGGGGVLPLLILLAGMWAIRFSRMIWCKRIWYGVRRVLNR